MDFEYTARMRDYQDRLRFFMERHIYPNRRRYEEELSAGLNRWRVLPLIEELKPLARAEGLWNLFMPPSHGEAPVNAFRFDGPGLTNLEYAILAEEMGRVRRSGMH